MNDLLYALRPDEQYLFLQSMLDTFMPGLDHVRKAQVIQETVDSLNHV